MPQYTAGPTLVGDVANQRRDFDVSDKIVKHMPDETPWTILLMRAAKESVPTSKFFWYDDPPPTWSTTVDHESGDGNSYADDHNAIRVVDPSIFVPGDAVKVCNADVTLGEILFTTAVNLTTRVVTFTRAYATPATRIAAAVIPHGTTLMKLAPGSVENSLSPETRQHQPDELFNVTQTTRTAFDGSWEAANEPFKTKGNERTRLQSHFAVQHKLAIERTSIFGQIHEDAAADRRMTGGLLQFLGSEKVYDAGGVLTEAEFENFLEEGFQYGTKTKLLLGAPRVGSVINQFAAGRIQTVSGQKSYGIKLKEYQSFHGTLYIATSRTFEGDYGSMGLLLDLENIKFKNQRNTTLKTNIQENDRDGWKDEYLTHWGMQVRAAKTHAILLNASA